MTLVGTMDCVTVRMWAASLVRRRGLKRTNDHVWSHSFQGEVKRGEGGPEHGMGRTGDLTQGLLDNDK